MAKNIIILGMARSGTSLAASIFANKGYFVTATKDTDLQVADLYNPSGYWEANSLIEENKNILKMAGYNYDNTWFQEPISDHQSAMIHQLEAKNEHKNFVKQYNCNSPWLWKDPRLCHTLAYWWPLVDHENTRVLLVTRHHQEIINSFKRVANDWQTTIKLDSGHINERINQHIALARQTLKKYRIPYIEIDYSDYRKRPVYTAKILSQFFDIKLTADDLGYQNKSNHSSIQGQILYRINRYSTYIKKSLKALLIEFGIIKHS